MPGSSRFFTSSGGAVLQILSGSFFLHGEFSFAHPNRNPKLCLFDAVAAYHNIS